MNDALYLEFMRDYSETEYPPEFERRYEVVECLAHRESGETLLVKDRESGGLFVARCRPRTDAAALSEGALLRSLHHSGLPAYVGEYADGSACCLVREYVRGTPLNKAAVPLSPRQSVDVGVQLCDILTYLHSRTPPVIHRDIKPQNVIVAEDGRVKLIDFDISRTYQAGADTDTVFFGTQDFAPPEQYGFAQTDSRSDIFSLGILLCWLLTGSTSPDRADIPGRRLRAVIRKCAAFSPKERYRDAAAAKAALKRCVKSRVPRLAAVAAAAVAAGLFLWLGLGGVLGQGGIVFSEPLVEKAVRLQLDKTGGEPLTQEDLLSVTEIYLFGEQAATNGDAFCDGLGGALRDSPPGGIKTLSDIRLLPNLRVLYVNHQSLYDLSAVAGLKQLEYIDLRHTRVSDIAPLRGMASLRTLNLFDTAVSDFSPLASCPALQELNIGGTSVASLDELPELKNLRVLHLRKLPISSLKGIEKFPLLSLLTLVQTQISDLTPLLSLSALSQVTADGAMRSGAEALDGRGNFTFVFEE